MPSIVGKKQAGKTYYYLVESARVGGKPRIVSQRYLGSAEEIAARLSEAGPGEPDRTRHLAFGEVAAVWSVLGRLEVAAIVDEVVGARRSDAAASVGTYIALAALNRVCDPCSKRAFAEWWATTAGDRWLHLPASALDHRPERLLAFYDYPVEHWVHLRTTNPIESTFSTVRLRTRVTRDAGSRKAALAIAYKLLDAAQVRWHHISAPELVPLVRAGATFIDGKLQERRPPETEPAVPGDGSVAA